MPANADKVRALHDSLTAQVEALVSGDDWARFLAVAARFHSYSPNNVWLVLAQRPDASSRPRASPAWSELPERLSPDPMVDEAAGRGRFISRGGGANSGERGGASPT